MSRHTRKICQRWLIEGTLELITPTHLSNGDKAFDVDMPLLLDTLEERPLLTGASLAGALRNYLNECLGEYAFDTGQLFTERPTSRTSLLFGAARRDNEGDQSFLIVNDALGNVPAAQAIELRDGVRIDPKTRTAADQAKFDLQLLPAGTTFAISLELIITEPQRDHLPEMRRLLAQALYGLQASHIHLGGRKRRGLGECRIRQWRLREYDLTQPADLRHWLAHGRVWAPTDDRWQSGADIRDLLGVNLPQTDPRNWLTIEATFAIEGSVLIRAGFESDYGPDMAHLESRRNGQMAPILSGSSLAGAMRAQALRIAHTVSGDEDKAMAFVRRLFGYMPIEVQDSDAEKIASRVLVKEAEIRDYQKLVQSRVAIDRFTGGALESALFTEQPVFGGQTTLTLVARPPLLLDSEAAQRQWQAEKGLLLLVLKDLWTGFMPIGGEASVGRGRLQGKKGSLVDENGRWELGKAGQPFVSQDDPAVLQTYVAAFTALMRGGAV